MIINTSSAKWLAKDALQITIRNARTTCTRPDQFRFHAAALQLFRISNVCVY
jgi:hypothetical protein